MRIEPTMRGWMAAFFRQRRIFAAIFLLCVGGGLSYILLATPEYEAAGSLLVKFGRGATPEIALSDNSAPEIITQSDRRETIQSDMDILQSHGLLYEVVHMFGAEKLYPGITKRLEGNDDPDEAAIRKLWKSDLMIKSNPQSNVINVSLLNKSPIVAAQFVHALFQHFITRQSEVFNKPHTNFLEAEVKEAHDKLEKSQQELEQYKEEKGISSIDDELAELLRQKSDAGTASLEEDSDAWENLAQMQAKETQMLATYLPTSPEVLRQHQSVELAKRQLRQHQSEHEARIKNATSRINQRIALLEAQRNHYNDLARQVDIDEKNYKNYELRSENARINDLLNRNSITPIAVVDEPVAPTKPLHPRKKLVMAMCLLAGLVFGTGAALGLETLDPRFTTPEQVADLLGVPIMANFS